MKTDTNNTNNNGDIIMKTYLDELFDERMYKIFKDNYGYNDDNVVEAVKNWKKNHLDDYNALKDDFYDEIHGEW